MFTISEQQIQSDQAHIKTLQVKLTSANRRDFEEEGDEAYSRLKEVQDEK